MKSKSTLFSFLLGLLFTCIFFNGYANRGNEGNAEAALCGDGIPESGKGCDGGNTTSCDGCSDHCALEPEYACSNGIPNVYEVCPGGLTISAPTPSQTGTTGTWTAPSTGTWKVRITTKGAKGGFSGAAGAVMIGDFLVSSGQTLEAIAGAPGGNPFSEGAGGGGGGSGVLLSPNSILIVAGGGAGKSGWGEQGGQVVSGAGNGGVGMHGAGGGGVFSAGGNGFTNGIGNAPGGGGAGYNATGGLGRYFNFFNILYIGGNGGGGFGGGGGGNISVDRPGGGGGGGYSGGNGGSSATDGSNPATGGGSFNLGANQNNTSGANSDGGQVIIECLGPAVFTAMVNATQPVCPNASQGSLSIDLTGDNEGNTAGLEYAIVAGSSFTGNPAFSSITADPFDITSGFGTTSGTYTVRTRLRYNPDLYVDQTYTISANVVPDVMQPVNQVVCNVTSTASVHFTGSLDGTTFNWTNANPSIGLAASGTGNIASFIGTNPGTAPVTATITVTPSIPTGEAPIGNVYYIRRSAGENWGGNANPDAMNAVFGSGNWTLTNFLAANPATIFTAGTRFVFMEGGNSGAIELNNFLTANLTTIENWVSAGGRIFINAAPNVGSSFSLGFGGVNLIYPRYSSNSSAAIPGHPIFVGPFTPITTSYTGGFAAHAVLSGTFTTLMNGSAPGPVLGSLNWGAGLAMFGCFTLPGSPGMGPYPQSQNLYQNIIYYTSGQGEPGPYCTGPSKTFTITVNPTPNAVATPSTQTTCSGNAISTIALTGNVTGTAFNWVRDNTGTVTGIAASGAGDISGALTNTTNAPVTVTFIITPTAEGCPGTPIMATILVNPTPNAVAMPASQTICSGATITTIALSGNVSGTVYNWIRDNTGTVTGIAASGAGDISGVLTNTTNAPVTVTFMITPTGPGPNNCVGPTTDVTVTVAPSPAITCPSPFSVNSSTDGPGNCSGAAAWAHPTETAGACGPITLTMSIDSNTPVSVIPGGAASEVLPVGPHTVTYVVSDGNTPTPNIATCSFTVTVVDDELPTITCPAMQTLALGANCTAILPDYTTLAITGDNCGVQTVTQSPAAGILVGSAGFLTVTLRVMDVNGKFNECAFPVAKVDNTPPIISCPATQTLVLGANCTATLPNYASLATTDDNCGVQSVTQSPTAGTLVFGAGNMTVTLTVTDLNGNETECTFTVTKVDQTPPTISCPTTQTLVLGANCTATLPSYTSLATTGDNCGVQNVTQLPTAGTSVSGSGNMTVTLTVTDVNGNNTPCTFTVTKVDNTPPTITCPTTQTLVLGANCTATLPNYTSLATTGDNCGVQSVTQSPTADTTVSGAGNMTVTLTVTDVNGNNTPCTFTVTKVDNTPPTITCPTTQTLVLGANCTATLPNYTSLATTGDNCGVQSVTQTPIAGTTVSGAGDMSVTLKVTDLNGNDTECTFTVTKVDNNPPSITCPATQTLVLGANCTATLPNYTSLATTDDNCGVQSVTQSPTAGTSVSGAGNMTVTLMVADVNGNETECTFTVTKVDNTPPTINCPTSQTLVLGANCTATLPNYTSLATTGDNCGVQSVTQSPIAGTSVSGAGNMTVTLTVADVNGLTNSCTFTVTKVDNTPPTVVCINTTVFIGNTGTYTLQVADVFNATASSDNCSGMLTVTNISPAMVSCAQLNQTIPVTVTVQDASGNTATCTAQVTVQEGSALPVGWNSADVGTANGGAGYKACSFNGSFTVSANGFSTSSSDVLHFTSQQLCGNGEIIARVMNVTGGGWAGVMLRESLAPGSRKITLKTQLTNIIRREIRSVTNGAVSMLNINRPQHVWLRLVRNGSNFIGYTSLDGTNWDFAFSASVSMTGCIYAGVFGESTHANTTTSANFSNVSIIGAQNNLAPNPSGGVGDLDGIMPSLEVNVFPNPTSGAVQVKFANTPIRLVNIQVFNALGEMILLKETDGADSIIERLDLSDLADGVYFITVQAAGYAPLTKRVVLAK